MIRQNEISMSCNFRVSAAGCEFRASKVRNIERAVELETVREGGCNGYVRTLVKPAAEPKKLVFERGLSALPDAEKLVLQLGIPQAAPLMITVYDRTNTQIRKVYMATGWMLVKWQLGELDALGGVLLETVEAVYETLTETVP